MTAQPTDMARPEGVWRSAMALVSNWLRTILWTARGGLIGLCLWRGLNA